MTRMRGLRQVRQAAIFPLKSCIGINDPNEGIETFNNVLIFSLFLFIGINDPNEGIETPSANSRLSLLINL